jgi:hypothetical protein
MVVISNLRCIFNRTIIPIHVDGHAIITERTDPEIPAEGIRTISRPAFRQIRPVAAQSGLGPMDHETTLDLAVNGKREFGFKDRSHFFQWCTHCSAHTLKAIAWSGRQASLYATSRFTAQFLRLCNDVSRNSTQPTFQGIGAETPEASSPSLHQTDGW